jgi:hypothetical protein
MAVTAQRGISAPPEVVFDTATDPARSAAWLPDPLRTVPGAAEFAATGGLDDPDPVAMRAEWHAEGDGSAGEWTAVLHVRRLPAGGAAVRLDLDGAGSRPARARMAQESLAALARAVADNLSAG